MNDPVFARLNIGFLSESIDHDDVFHSYEEDENYIVLNNYYKVLKIFTI